MALRFIWLPSQSPYHNLAAEEVLLTRSHCDIVMFWQNEKSVIVGRHQNTLSEINPNFVEREHIIVARRLTGGGAVFHDTGNLNFTLIQNINPKDKKIDFIKYLHPIVAALQSLGLPATFSGRNDITIKGKKVSGNAMAFYENRMLAHGTLLFSTRKRDLTEALKAEPAKFADKAVKSVHSRVTNISQYLSRPMSVTEFKNYLMNFLIRQYPDSVVKSLTQEEEEEIQQLERNKYNSWEWNFGKSPKYTYERKVRTRGGTVQVLINVINGLIEDIRFYGDFFSCREPANLAAMLTGLPHERAAMTKVLKAVTIEEYFNGMNLDELMSLLI